MDNIRKDIQRLEFMSDDWCALERFSITTRLKDLVKYYFTRFLTNVRLAFKDFSKSELEIYNQRYHIQIRQTLKDPLMTLKGYVVPVPKGMTKSYLETVESLIGLLSSVTANSLTDDLDNIVKALNDGDIKRIHSPNYSKKEFEQDKKILGSLFSKVGLTHLPAESVFSSFKEVTTVNTILLTLTKEFYPCIIELNVLIEEIEKSHNNSTISPEYNDILKDALMETAYRISIFASVMDKVLVTEHAFVKALSVFRDIESKL